MRLPIVFAVGLLALGLTACGTQPVTSGSAFGTKVFDFTQIAPLQSQTSAASQAFAQSASATGGNNAAANNINQGNVGTLQQNAQGLVPINVGTQTQGPNVAVNVIPQFGGVGSTGYMPTW